MSTKQSVVFAFMIVFLASTLITLGMWFHFALELNIQKKALAAVETRKQDLGWELEKLVRLNTDPDIGFERRLEQITIQADELERQVNTDPDARKALFEQKKDEIEGAWKAGTKKWTALYADWSKRNAKLKASAKSLKEFQATSAVQMSESEREYLEVIRREEKDRKVYLAKRRVDEDKLEEIRHEAEELRARVASVSRELENTPEEEADGVVIFSAPDLNTVTVNLGYHHGARRGMKFKIFSSRHNFPIRKGILKLTTVRALTSDALVLPHLAPTRWDSVTGYETNDPHKRYSIYHAEGGTDAVRLELRKTKKDIVEDIRIERIRREQGAEKADEARRRSDSPEEPPIQAELGDEMVMPGDWISNTSFVRIDTERNFRKKVNDELLSLKNVNIGTLTFYIADSVRPYRQESLKRLCLRNLCRVTDEMTSDVDFVVTTNVAANAKVLEKSLLRFDGQDEVPDVVARRRTTLAALNEAAKYGSQIIPEDKLEPFFLKRKRKSDLTQGKVIQPGQYRFYVVGETRRRSLRETKLYIKELGGKLAPKLNEDVDYVVVGAGLDKATLDIKTGHVYPESQMAADIDKGIYSFYDAVAKMGWKVLREDALAEFFGRK